MRNQRKEGTFKAVDRFGQTHLIEVFIEILSGRVDGEKSLVTTDGESVERISKGVYRIVHGSIDLTSSDPLAP